MRFFICLLFSGVVATGVFAQRTCGAEDYNKMLHNAYPSGARQDAFEAWMKQKKALLHSPQATQSTSGTTVIYTIPVVVHVIHNGESVGVGSNISEGQILSQIEVMNTDFRHLNADSINTPGIFQPLMADIGFQFVLAKQDPNGLPTNGITRTTGTQTSWTMNQNDALKSLSYWPSDDYYNIWVAPLANGLLGWAEFPTTPLLSGLQDATNNPLTDGTVITYKAFGSKIIYPQGTYKSFFDLGRTATHETGHFFGLRHISGDGGCGIDDYVADTPEESSQHYNCPTPGTTEASCAVPPAEVMYMNYMEYVDDNCMNLFTQGQKDRMQIVINNSPRRKNLLSSHALLPPPLIDAAITAINSPGVGICSNSITPQFTIQNAGTTPVSTVEVSFLIDGIQDQLQTYAVNLAPQQDTLLSFNSINLTQFGTILFKTMINKVNGVADTLTFNNDVTIAVTRPQEVTQLNEQFDSWPVSWSIRTSAPVSYWNNKPAPNESVGNYAAELEYYNNPGQFPDELLTPIVDLSSFAFPIITFDLAYGYRGNFNDGLAITVSQDCGNTFPDTLFYKNGPELNTSSSPVDFTPAGRQDWQTEVLDLSHYSNSLIQLKFSGTSVGGNNIYLDNIVLHDQSINDLSIVGLENESGAISSSQGQLGLRIANRGTESSTPQAIEQFENGVLITTNPLNVSPIPPSTDQVVYVDNNLGPGDHTVTFQLTNADYSISNNSFTSVVHELDQTEIIPLRERFNNLVLLDGPQWKTTSPLDTQSWTVAQADNANTSAALNSFNTGNKGLIDWLILPRIDLLSLSEASLHFRIAYARHNNAEELLRLWLSTDGGKTMDIMLGEWTGSKMATATATTSWVPSSKDDWKPYYINLDDYVSQSDLIFAFEAIDGDGNNIFLDDIEFFVSDEATPLTLGNERVGIYPNPITDENAFITFNLDQREEVQVNIYNVQGHLVSRNNFPNILNQTLHFETQVQRSGIYIIHVLSKSLNERKKIIIQH